MLDACWGTRPTVCPVTDPRPEIIADDLNDDLALALHLAGIADAISLPRFGAVDLQVRAKPDLTPVSDADTAVERALRAVLAAQRPQDAVLGEEYGDSVTGDGDGGCVGADSGADQGTARRCWAAAGRGAFTRFADNPTRPCRVSQVGELADASLSFSEMSEWRASDVPDGLGDAFAAVSDACWRTRAYGDFYSYVLVAEGAVDIAAEPDLSLWDLAALVPIVTEAGGRMTDVQGQPSGALTTSALATNRLLHDPVLAVLRAEQPRPAASG